MLRFPRLKTTDRGVAEAQDQLWVSPMFAADDSASRRKPRHPPLAYRVFSSRHQFVTGLTCTVCLRVRAQVLDIGDNLLRAANYSDMFGTSDAYVVNSEGILLSPSHFEQELRKRPVESGSARCSN